VADERKCYAGDLGSDAIGKTVVVPRHGLDDERRGTVLSVSHDQGLTGKPITSVVMRPGQSIGVRQLVTVDSLVVVEVKP
jgi:hypothetical protein